MSGFSIGWLDLREEADFVARDRTLAASAVDWLAALSAQGLDPIVVDLGCGTGSTLRSLMRLGAGKAVWRLVDHDAGLLDEALKRHGKTCLIEDYRSELGNLAELPLGGARLVTASALFDLVSRDFVDTLVARVARHRAGLYAALSYDGATSWEPAHPQDAAVLTAFNADQRRDKGFGPALGPDAAAYLRERLEQEGFSVFVASSPWKLEGKDHRLVDELIRGIVSAVHGTPGLNNAALQDWQSFRLQHAAEGICIVGHQDLLALPR